MPTTSEHPGLSELEQADTVSAADDSAPVSSPDTTRRHFLPGARFGRRYRIVELLGRGGMGEVYRADDLHLGQAVALKFLPKELIGDPTALARLRNEVRVARHVSHPNVCRVYDLDEVDGQPFLAMEYVDGEDLGSVLRRLGRPTREKAIQIARQLCAGLAAAHEVGVLHRDLKPANVMIDGKGRVRITDFGLASFVDELAGTGSRHGTPGYMAPEQLERGQISARSDLYALGLTLYELFTGRPAYRARSFDELRRLQQETPPTPSNVVNDLDSAIEHVVLRCLEHDPHMRPGSALAVSAALPGGDPIAEALAAGETPSPEIVAAAGGEGGLRPVTATVTLAAILLGLAWLWFAQDTIHDRLPAPEKPPVVLADAARRILADLGAPEPVDRAHWIWTNGALLDYITENDPSPDRWDHIVGRRPTAYRFAYRESPSPMLARNPTREVWFDDPPAELVGSARVLLDAEGRLEYLEIVPPQLTVEATGEAAPPGEFDRLFEAAGLDRSTFVDVEPRWTPPVYADTRRAWVGTYPGQDDFPIRIEAASFAGTPTFFDVIHPYDRPWREPEAKAPPSAAKKALEPVSFLFMIGVLVAAPWFARRNLRAGSGDRRGAMRLGIAVLVAALVVGALTVPPTALLSNFIDAFVPGFALAIFFAGWTACAYLALEPYARRVWPKTLITWTRVLLGQFRDPRVGRDVLLGTLAGVAIVVLQGIERSVPGWFGEPVRPPFGSLQSDGLHALAELFVPEFLAWPTLMLLILTGARFVFRRPWPAALVTLVLLVLLDGYWETSVPVGAFAVVTAVLETILVWAGLLYLLIRFGLFALAVASFVVFRLQQWPFTVDPSDWYATTSIAFLVFLVVGSLLAYRIAIGGRVGLRSVEH